MLFIRRSGSSWHEAPRGKREQSIKSCCNLVDIDCVDIGALLQSLFLFDKNHFKFRPWDGTCDLTYLLDQFLGRLKGTASEWGLQCPEEKKVRGCGVR
jgi:hypothetical protein